MRPTSGAPAVLRLLAIVATLPACAASLPPVPALRAPPPPPPPAPAAMASVAAPAESPFKLALPCGETDLVGCTNGCAEERQEDCVTLGAMYMAGEHVTVDRERAIALFRAACDTGSARGCMRLGDVYHAGILTDEVEETRLYGRACAAGANLGCVSAGRAYLAGRGVGADPAQAAALFVKVCERGTPSPRSYWRPSSKHAGALPRDEARAQQLFTKACKLGHDEGCLYASRKEETLPPRN
jgi:uncharacterized protein